MAPGDGLPQERNPENFTGYLTEEDKPQDFDEEEERGMDGSEDEDDEAPL